jgi:hypothetical protein
MIPNALPPRGIFVPTTLIFHADLPPAPLRTWMQLRCLAWTGWSTPPLTMAELASRLGLHTSRLSKHLAQLSDDSALSYHLNCQGKIIITFPDQPLLPPEPEHTAPEHTGDTSSNSDHRLSEPATSYFPKRILGYISYEDDDEDFLLAENIFTEPTQNLSAMDACSSKQPLWITR